MKLSEIDDKLEATELQEIASLRVTDDLSITPQNQAIKWQEYYIGLRIAALKEELEVAKVTDISKYTPLKQKIFKLDEKRRSLNRNLEEK